MVHFFRLLSLCFALTNFVGAAAAENVSVEGVVTKVRDGDTIEIGPIAVRLKGVSAPELKEPLGHKSKAFLVDLVMGKNIRCGLNGDKTYDRFVGNCFLRGQDIGASVISAGLALDCPRYSGGLYRNFELKIAKKQIKLPRYCRLSSD